MVERRELIASLLSPPFYCTAYLGLPFKDRKGGIWYCDHARKIIGKGRVSPECLCRSALLNAKDTP